jgi:hypothetical protein
MLPVRDLNPDCHTAGGVALPRSSTREWTLPSANSDQTIGTQEKATRQAVGQSWPASQKKTIAQPISQTRKAAVRRGPVRVTSKKKRITTRAYPSQGADQRGQRRHQA